MANFSRIVGFVSGLSILLRDIFLIDIPLGYLSG